VNNYFLTSVTSNCKQLLLKSNLPNTGRSNDSDLIPEYQCIRVTYMYEPVQTVPHHTVLYGTLLVEHMKKYCRVHTACGSLQLHFHKLQFIETEHVLYCADCSVLFAHLPA